MKNKITWILLKTKNKILIYFMDHMMDVFRIIIIIMKNKITWILLKTKNKILIYFVRYA